MIITNIKSHRTKVLLNLMYVMFMFFVTFVNIGCIADTSSLEKDVKKLMIETMREKGHRLTINELILVHQSDNNYEGLAKGTFDGEKIELNVYVIYDGVNVKAEWEPTEAYVQEENERFFEEQQKEYNRIMDDVQRQQEQYQKEADKLLQELNNDIYY